MKILYLVPRKTFLTKTSRVRFHQIEEISKLSQLTYSGIGWDNFDNKKTLSENIKKIYDGDKPDIIISFDHFKIKNFVNCKIPKVIMMNEMHSPEGDKKSALRMILSGGYDFVVCHHKNEMESPVFDSIRSKMINIPHHVNFSIFKDYNLEKTIDVLLCGSLRLEKYQLRKKLINVIGKLQEIGINAQIHPHPGPRPDAHTNKYMIDFAKIINRSRICLTCSSIYKCAFAKYVEIPLCKSLIMADIPNERQNFFCSFVEEINKEDSDEKIVKRILNLLENSEELEKKTNIGFEKNKTLSMQNYAKKFMIEINKFFKIKIF